MTQLCAYCQGSPYSSKRRRVFPNTRALAMHTADAHPGKEPKRFKQVKHPKEREQSIADMVIDAKLRAAMGCPEEYDEFILAGFD